MESILTSLYTSLFALAVEFIQHSFLISFSFPLRENLILGIALRVRFILF